MEKIALSHILNAEAEKTQAFVGQKLDFPHCSGIKTIIDFNMISSEFMDKIIMKQWLLLSKLNKVIEVSRSCFNNE